MASSMTTADELCEAAFMGDAVRVKELLAQGSSASAVDRAGFLPLHRAAVAGMADIASMLLAAGAEPNKADAVSGAIAELMNHDDAHHTACLLQYGDTALHYAAFCGHVDVVKALLQAGADASLPGSDGRTPLAAALEEGHTAMANLLIEATEQDGDGSKGPAIPPTLPLMLPAASALSPGGIVSPAAGFPSSAPSSVLTSPQSAAIYSNNVSQLGDAAYAGDVRSVYRLLAQAGADVNGADADGFTPLHRAATAGNQHVLELLVSHGADPNARDSAGCTPLHYAAFCGHADACHMLLAAGADPSRRNRDGCTALDIARAESRPAVVRLLGGTYTRAENLDFSWGVALEGELKAKRATGVAFFRWKNKYAVLSRSYRSLFLWTGSATTVEGPVTRVRLDQIDSIQHDARGSSKRFVIKPIASGSLVSDLIASDTLKKGQSFAFGGSASGGSGGASNPIELMAATGDDAAIWVASIKAVMVSTSEDDSKAALYRQMIHDAQHSAQAAALAAAFDSNVALRTPAVASAVASRRRASGLTSGAAPGTANGPASAAATPSTPAREPSTTSIARTPAQSGGVAMIEADRKQSALSEPNGNVSPSAAQNQPSRQRQSHRHSAASSSGGTGGVADLIATVSGIRSESTNGNGEAHANNHDALPQPSNGAADDRQYSDGSVSVSARPQFDELVSDASVPATRSGASSPVAPETSHSASSSSAALSPLPLAKALSSESVGHPTSDAKTSSTSVESAAVNSASTAAAVDDRPKNIRRTSKPPADLSIAAKDSRADHAPAPAAPMAGLHPASSLRDVKREHLPVVLDGSSAAAAAALHGGGSSGSGGGTAANNLGERRPSKASNTVLIGSRGRAPSTSAHPHPEGPNPHPHSQHQRSRGGSVEVAASGPGRGRDRDHSVESHGAANATGTPTGFQTPSGGPAGAAASPPGSPAPASTAAAAGGSALLSLRTPVGAGGSAAAAASTSRRGSQIEVAHHVQASVGPPHTSSSKAVGATASSSGSHADPELASKLKRQMERAAHGINITAQGTSHAMAAAAGARRPMAPTTKRPTRDKDKERGGGGSGRSSPSHAVAAMAAAAGIGLPFGSGGSGGLPSVSSGSPYRTGTGVGAGTGTSKGGFPLSTQAVKASTVTSATAAAASKRTAVGVVAKATKPTVSSSTSSTGSKEETRRTRAALTLQRMVRGFLARRLVRGWVRCVDDADGDIYWYNTRTGASSWFAPGDAAAAEYEQQQQ